LVAGRAARGDHADMQPGGTARHADRVRRAHERREGRLEPLDVRPDAQVGGTENVVDQLALARSDIGRRHRHPEVHPHHGYTSLAGTPTTVAPGRTSRSTTAPAPT